MAGTWESQNKELAGVYLNNNTNEPLSITPGDRGTVAILQELSVGTDKTVYTITATDAAYPENATTEDKRLATEALKGAKTVLLYKLPEGHDSDDVQEALGVLETMDVNTISYPYDGTNETDEGNYETAKTVIMNWIQAMYDDEGVPMQAVMANVDADSDSIINITQGVVLSDGTTLTAAQTTAWVAGVTAGASMTTSNTIKKYVGAVYVVPRMKTTAMEAASKAGTLVLKVDKSQNVTIAYDVNSLTTYTDGKSKEFRKNRVVRTIDNIKSDLGIIYESSYVNKYDNEPDGQLLLKGVYCEYFKELNRKHAIKNFVTDDVTVTDGTEVDAVYVAVDVQPVDSIEKIYVDVNLV